MTKIENMTNGQAGYTPPWTLYMQNKKFWLIGNYELVGRPKGTCELKVAKLNGKYYVDTSLCRYIWEEERVTGNFTPISVSEIRANGISKSV